MLKVENDSLCRGCFGGAHLKRICYSVRIDAVWKSLRDILGQRYFGFGSSRVERMRPVRRTEIWINIDGAGCASWAWISSKWLDEMIRDSINDKRLCYKLGLTNGVTWSNVKRKWSVRTHKHTHVEFIMCFRLTTAMKCDDNADDDNEANHKKRLRREIGKFQATATPNAQTNSRTI